MDNGKNSFLGVVDISVVADKTIREIERMDYSIQRAGGCQPAGISQKEGIAAMYLWKKVRGFRYTDKGTRLTVRELIGIADDARSRFLQQHIINYAAFYVTQYFYDWLCDKRKITKSSEGFWRKAFRVMNDYMDAHMSYLDKQTWMFFQDHMRLSFDAIKPEIDAMEVSIRDYLIQHRNDILSSGQADDITLLQKAAVCIIFLSAMNHSYRDYFTDIINAHGVDFSSEFRYAELSKMSRNVVWMCESIGIRFSKDKDGDMVFTGVNINDSVRVNSQWSMIVNKLGDADFLDATAMHAISLNPEEKKKYDDEIARLQAEKDEREYAENLNMLETKYNVKKTCHG